MAEGAFSLVGKNSALRAILIKFPDCSIALLRVHLPRDHVVSVVLLRPRPGSRTDLDDRHRRTGALHLSDHMVSNTKSAPRM